MKVVLLGTGQLGYQGLQEIIRQWHEVLAVYTFDNEITEDVTSRDFQALASFHAILCCVQENINTLKEVSRIRGLAPDLILSLFWKRLVGTELLAIPRIGAVNIHQSLLPRYH